MTPRQIYDGILNSRIRWYKISTHEAIAYYEDIPQSILQGKGYGASDAHSNLWKNSMKWLREERIKQYYKLYDKQRPLHKSSQQSGLKTEIGNTALQSARNLIRGDGSSSG